jgi:hypothetical protein
MTIADSRRFALRRHGSLSASQLARDTRVSQNEAVPNSYAGSGRAAFPRHDGGHVSGRVPETYPCHKPAKQNGELDLRRVTLPDWRFSAASRAARVGVVHATSPDNASAQLESGSACGQPRMDPQMSFAVKLGPRRGGQSKPDGVGPVPQGSQSGLMAQKEAPQVRSPLTPQFAVQLPTPGRVWLKCCRASSSPPVT